ncbi:MAG TPA: hypothetical protein VL832_06630 [Puia sp.]|nr:hypothetical protein [Puia sp.]
MYKNEGPSHALSYRLRSARQKRRSQKEDFNKRLIQLAKQRNKCWQARRQLPWIPLTEPYQKGWIRFFVLREDVKRSRNAVFYQTLLDKINTFQHHSDKMFKVKRRWRGKKIYEVKAQSLKEISEWEWNSPKCKLTEQEKMFFYRKETLDYSGRNIIIQYAYVDPWRFVLQIRPYMITKIKMIDADLEREIQQLENHIEKNHLQHKIYKMTKGRRQHSWRKNKEIHPKDQDPYDNMPLYRILDACREENL